jgi:hypothetical protein
LGLFTLFCNLRWVEYGEILLFSCSGGWNMAKSTS